MARGIVSYQPKVSVVLKKTIGRKTVGAAGGEGIAAAQRFKGAERELDLTPYLGQGGSVVVRRSTREPAGMWSVTLADEINQDTLDSLYGLVEPMDVVEIRMARDTSLYAGEYERSMPIMMYGFVTRVQRNQVMTERGPQRQVTISGQDYGKVLQMMRVEYRFGYIIGQNLITALKLAVNYGVEAQAYEDAAEFIIEIMDKVINTGSSRSPGFLSLLRETAAPGLSSPVQNIGVIATKGNGAVLPFGAQDWSGGAIYDLLKMFGDVGPWNEMFIEDREALGDAPAGPYLIYRPTPFRNLKGEPIQASEAAVDLVAIADSDLVSLDSVRSDEGVANAFYVNAPRYDLVQGQILKAQELVNEQPDDYVLQNKDLYPNALPQLYGLRVMEATTNQGMRTDGQPEAAYDEGNAAGVGLTAEKRRVLIANNKDNVVFESGSMRLKGLEAIRPGVYVRLTRGGSDFSADHYAYDVAHEYSPFVGYFTTVNYDRGTGFVERIQREGGANSPYLSEMTKRGNYA